MIPAYNEYEVIDELGVQLASLMDRHPQYDFEAIIVENGSFDNSIEKLRSLHERDRRFKVVRLSRNFTADGGVCAGLRHATGDCAILMDADLQDPPEVVDKFIERWEAGIDVVYGIIRSREAVSGLRHIGNRIFYWLVNRVSDGMIPENVTAFRLMDRKVYEVINDMPETNRFTRGLCSWTGFTQEGVEFDRRDRFAGKAKAGFLEVLKEGFDALVSFSFVPLKIIGMLGLSLSIICLLLLVVDVLLALFYNRGVSGIETVIVLMMFMFSFVFLSLGIMGEYLGRIFDEVKHRPNYIVRERYGFDAHAPDASNNNRE